MATVSYIHLMPGTELPALTIGDRFQAVVIIDAEVVPEWQHKVSTWLVASGCRYMMAWGIDCASWDDSVDWAALELFDFYTGKETLDRDPDFVMTTWQNDEPLEEALAFCHYCAWDYHLEQRFDSTMLIHIADAPQPERILRAFESSATLWSE